MNPFSRPKDVGIIAMEVYFPSTYVSQNELEKHDGVSTGKYTVGLGQDEMGFCYENEDIHSLCLTVVSKLMKKNKIPYSEIGRLEIGTETMLDKSKSAKSTLMQLFEESGNFDVEGIDTKNACYGGTSALFNSIAWIESSVWDGRYALCVCADIAVYAKGPARCTGGAGAIAMLLGPNAPIVMDPVRSTYMRHAYDFYKPDMTSEYPIVDGKLSVESYTTALNQCYQGYCTKAKKFLKNDCVSLMDLDYMVFHCPYTKLVRKSLARLCLNDFVNGRTVKYPESEQEKLKNVQQYRNMKIEETTFNREMEQAFIKVSENIFQSKTNKSLLISRKVGNMYTPSLYSGLASILLSQPLMELCNQRIGFFSYGSGLASSMFSFRVCPDNDSVRFHKLEQLLKGLSDVEERLQSRHMISPSQFTKALELREMCNKQGSYKCQTDASLLFPGTYYLTEVDEKFRRSYKVNSANDVPMEGQLDNVKPIENGYH